MWHASIKLVYLHQQTAFLQQSEIRCRVIWHSTVGSETLERRHQRWRLFVRGRRSWWRSWDVVQQRLVCSVHYFTVLYISSKHTHTRHSPTNNRLLQKLHIHRRQSKQRAQVLTTYWWPLTRPIWRYLCMLVHTMVNMHTKFQMSSFTRSSDTIKAQKL